MIEEMNKVKALFPENVEKIIITKNDYDRLTGDLTLENIELKQEIERLNNIINKIKSIIYNSIEYNALTKVALIRESLQGSDKE